MILMRRCYDTAANPIFLTRGPDGSSSVCIQRAGSLLVEP